MNTISQRIEEKPERTVYYVDVGSMSIKDAEKTVEYYRNLLSEHYRTAPKKKKSKILKLFECFSSSSQYNNPFTSHVE
jgi:hypothetical protein